LCFEGPGALARVLARLQKLVFLTVACGADKGEEGKYKQPAEAIAGFRSLDRLDLELLPLGGSAAHLSRLVSFCCCIPKPSQILLWWQ